MSKQHGTLATYCAGFVLSVLLTLAAYTVVTRSAATHHSILAVIMLLAVLQVLVQLVFFLHLGRGPNSRWKLVVLAFMLLVLGILVGGSLWIMNNLNYNMVMTPSQIAQDEGVQ
jgi:cytochrome o ubiquinol oxidase operon protein cyoD